MPHDPCPCGLPDPYDACCGRFHAGALAGLAPTPEALMRSRYTAFVKDLRSYLLDTWHPSHRPAAMDAPEAGLKWLGLAVKGCQQHSETEGTVTFVARYKVAGRAFRLEETSQFVRENGRWFYVCAAPDAA